MLSIFNSKLLSHLIGLARAISGNEDLVNDTTKYLIFDSLLNLHQVDSVTSSIITRITEERKRLIPNCFYCENSCGRNDLYNIDDFNNSEYNIKSIKLSILLNIIDFGSIYYYSFNDDLFKQIIHSLQIFGLNEVSYDYLYSLNGNLINCK